MLGNHLPRRHKIKPPPHTLSRLVKYQRISMTRMIRRYQNPLVLPDRTLKMLDTPQLDLHQPLNLRLNITPKKTPQTPRPPVKQRRPRTRTTLKNLRIHKNNLSFDYQNNITLIHKNKYSNNRASKKNAPALSFIASSAVGNVP
jgi:hypothetical protein